MYILSVSTDAVNHSSILYTIISSNVNRWWLKSSDTCTLQLLQRCTTLPHLERLPLPSPSAPTPPPPLSSALSLTAVTSSTVHLSGCETSTLPLLTPISLFINPNQPLPSPGHCKEVMRCTVTFSFIFQFVFNVLEILKVYIIRECMQYCLIDILLLMNSPTTVFGS